MEGPEPPLSAGEIRILRTLISKLLEHQPATGQTFGGDQVQVLLRPLLCEEDFEAAGQPLPPREPTPATDFVVWLLWVGALILLLIFGASTAAAIFGPPLVNFCRKALRTLIRFVELHFGRRQRQD